MSEEEVDLQRPLNRNNDESEFLTTQIDNQTDIDVTPLPQKAGGDEEKPNITKQYQFDGLTNMQMWAYSIGHFFNDLCAAVWFNYLLFYIKSVRNLPLVAPFSMLGGQIFDGLATPIVGILSDKTDTRIGKRTPWYLFGTVIVIFTFMPIFLYQFVPYKVVDDKMEYDWPEWALFVYFISFPSIFNIGWASVQISNMSLVPSLTCSNTRRDVLNGRRNTFTFVANLSVLVMAGVFFELFETVQAFEALAFFVVGVGLLTTTFFSLTVKEVPLVSRATQCLNKLKRILSDKYSMINTEDKTKHKSLPTSIRSQPTDETNTKFKNILKNTKNPKKSVHHGSFIAMMRADDNDIDFQVDENNKVQPSVRSMKMSLKNQELRKKGQKKNSAGWKQWFSEPMFYNCGVIYMFVRLYCNVMATMLPFYLAYVCELVAIDEDGDINVTNLPLAFAIVPMLLYVFSTVTSLYIDYFFQKIGRKRTYIIGSFFAGLSTVGFAITTKNYNYIVYPTACLGGIAQALCLNTGITLISDVIGSRGSEGAFVFGVYSFLDKFLTGIVLYVATDIFTMTATLASISIVIIPAVSVVIAGVCIAFIKTTQDEFKHGKKDNDNESQQSNNLEELQKELAQ